MNFVVLYELSCWPERPQQQFNRSNRCKVVRPTYVDLYASSVRSSVASEVSNVGGIYPVICERIYICVSRCLLRQLPPYVGELFRQLHVMITSRDKIMPAPVRQLPRKSASVHD